LVERLTRRAERAPQARLANVYLASPGFEHAVRLEATGLKDLQPGVLAGPASQVFDPAFARQVLPSALFVEGQGPSDLVDAALRSLPEDDESGLLAGRAALHIFAPDFMRQGSQRPSPHPLAGAAAELASLAAAKIAGRARKRGVDAHEGPPSTLVQLLLLDAWQGYLSAARFTPAVTLRSWPAAFPGGRAPVSGYQDAPSSAYRKLVEALAWLDDAPGPGDVVLDLGAAPGGWSYVAVQRGARVIAVDRANMDARLARSPLLEHLRKDAYAEVPLEQASWLLCDVIDLPGRTLDLIQRALGSPALSRLVVTVKLRRPLDKAALARARALATTTPGFEGRVKHLLHDKSEVTVMMRRAGA
jgi:23S rRNA (cytidine2498-2'-O)-methyltransferase